MLGELSLALGCRLCAIGLEIGIERPHMALDTFFGLAVLVREGIELVDKALGVDPTRRVVGNVELAGAVGDDDRAIQQPLAVIEPPSVATRTGSGMTSSSVIPSFFRCSIQAPRSAKLFFGRLQLSEAQPVGAVIRPCPDRITKRPFRESQAGNTCPEFCPTYPVLI